MKKKTRNIDDEKRRKTIVNNLIGKDGAKNDKHRIG